MKFKREEKEIATRVMWFLDKCRKYGEEFADSEPVCHDDFRSTCNFIMAFLKPCVPDDFDLDTFVSLYGQLAYFIGRHKKVCDIPDAILCITASHICVIISQLQDLIEVEPL